MSKPIVLTIAGSDSSGGAGIQADIKTISATGSYAASVITALTAQNTLGVQAVYDISSEFVQTQIESVATDLRIQAVKIGMLNNELIISIVAQSLKQFNFPSVVLDPVMISKNQHPLLAESAIAALEKELLPNVFLITPNCYEAEQLLKDKIKTMSDQASAAKTLAQKYHVNVLVKGGHFNREHASDVLYLHETDQYEWYSAERISSQNTHGTGCSLSSAIASYLAQGSPLQEAIGSAKKYLTQAIIAGKNLQIGQGFGPVDHFYYLA